MLHQQLHHKQANDVLNAQYSTSAIQQQEVPVTQSGAEHYKMYELEMGVNHKGLDK